MVTLRLTTITWLCLLVSSSLVAASPITTDIDTPVPCGTKVCTGGKKCCNASCGICVGKGEFCPDIICPPPVVKRQEVTRPNPRLCGTKLCGLDQRCCNPACGYCVHALEVCFPQICPAQGAGTS